MGCPMCGGPGCFLGQLGRTEHYRCRDCGWTYHLDAAHTVADEVDW